MPPSQQGLHFLTNSRQARPIGLGDRGANLTIAMCFLSPEGVILGADSTSSGNWDPGGFHFFNHNQKIFQIGRQSTLGLLTWGLGGLGPVSHRTLVAELDDALAAAAPASVQEVAERWSALFWGRYQAALAAEIARTAILAARPPHDPADATSRSADEEAELAALRSNYFVGFCIAGYVAPDRTPTAFSIGFHTGLTAAPGPVQLQHTSWWGAPNMILRLLNGWDGDLRRGILDSGHWSGTPDELDAVLQQHGLSMPTLPIRDAIDFVHACIHSTIKALKFSSLSQICGGPIELAVITTDRHFRWVRHKDWDAAIREGERPHALT
jgi:hypothetical protein